MFVRRVLCLLIVCFQQGHYFEEIPGHSAEESTAIYEGLKDALCIPTKVGSHFEATSTNDVSAHKGTATAIVKTRMKAKPTEGKGTAD